MPGVTVRLDGLRQLQRQLKKIETDLPKQMKAVAKSAANIVADEARAMSPYKTGRLSGTVKTGATAKGAYMKVGGKLPYSKVIMFGWPRHNITGNPFPYRALDAKRQEVINSFSRGIGELLKGVMG